MLFQPLQPQAGVQAGGDDGPQGMDMPVARRALAVIQAVVGDEVRADQRLAAEVAVARHQRLVRMGLEDFQEGMGLVDHQASARCQQALHRGEEGRQVRHPVQHADGDQHQVVLAEPGGQGIDVGGHQSRRQARGCGQLLALGEKGRRLVDAQGGPGAEGRQGKQFAGVVAADLRATQAADVQCGEGGGQAGIEDREAGLASLFQQVLPVLALGMQRCRQLPGLAIGGGDELTLVGIHGRPPWLSMQNPQPRR